MSIAQTHTTGRGECPLVDVSRCPDFCDAFQACITLERGECTFPDGLISGADNTPILAVRRTLFSFRIRLQNCSDNDLRINVPELSLVNRIILSNSQGVETSVDEVDVAQSMTNPTAGEAFLKILSLNSTCGQPNYSATNDVETDYNGGLPMGTGNPDASLLETSFTLPPGECCIDFVAAVDAAREDTAADDPFPDVILENACLVVSGRVNIGNACCTFQRSLIAPGECLLRSLRGAGQP